MVDTQPLTRGTATGKQNASGPSAGVSPGWTGRSTRSESSTALPLQATPGLGEGNLGRAFLVVTVLLEAAWLSSLTLGLMLLAS